MARVAPTGRRRGGFFIHVAPAVLYVVAVFYGGSAPVADIPRPLGPDKLVHLLGFAGMQFVWLRAIRFQLPEMSLKRQLLWATLVASALGAALELYQTALPYRSAELLDWVADTVGAVMAAVVLFFVQRGSAPPDLPQEVPQRDSEPVQG